MTYVFRDFLNFLKLLQGSPKLNEKKELIKTHLTNEIHIKFIKYTLDIFKKFKITKINPSGNLNNVNIDEKYINNLFNYLDLFLNKKALLKIEKEEFSNFIISGGQDSIDTVNIILSKKLSCGAQLSLFKSALPDVFSDIIDHQPMKGYDNIDIFIDQSMKKRYQIGFSFKLDGTRCWSRYSDESIKYLSRNGKEIPNFNIFNNSIESIVNKIKKYIFNKYNLNINEIILDGEVININGSFDKHMSEFRRIKNMDPSGFRFKVFDIIIPKLSNLIFRDRLKIIKECIPRNSFKHDRSDVTYIDLYRIPYDFDFIHLRDLVIDKYGVEGLILKTFNYKYEYKKSRKWCKVKRFETLDLNVINKIEGTGKYKNLLGALIVELNGKQIEVGSGYTDEERYIYWKNPPKMIEVKYQEITSSGSLRFPTFIRVRDDKYGE